MRDFLAAPTLLALPERAHGRALCAATASSEPGAAVIEGDAGQFRCPLLGAKQTLITSAVMSAFDPKRTSDVLILL